MNTKNVLLDTKTMSKRCISISLRNPDTLITSIVTPVLMMLLFAFVFGGSMNVGELSYVNYIVPGIILQCIGQCAATTAISVSSDKEKGIIDRFRSMPISQSSVLNGHVVESVLRNLITAAIVIVVALLIGFRPTAGITGWLLAIALLILYSIALSWLSVVFGLIASGPEGAGGFTIIAIVLPYLSSGFTSVDTMPTALRLFAQYQPLTPIINSIRSLLLDLPLENNLVYALIWCVAILIVSYIAAVKIYKRKLAK